MHCIADLVELGKLFRPLFPRDRISPGNISNIPKNVTMKQLAPLISYSPRGHPKRRSQEIASKWAIPNQFPIGGEDINTTVDHVSVIGKKFQIVVFRDLDDELRRSNLSLVFSVFFVAETLQSAYFLIPIGICFFAAEGKGAQRTQKEEEREGGEVIFPLCSLCSLWLKLFEVASN